MKIGDDVRRGFHTKTKAEIRMTALQLLLFSLFFSILILLILFFPKKSFAIIALCSLVSYIIIVGHKLIAVMCGLLFHNEETVDNSEFLAIDEDSLPQYSIMVPLYMESEVVAETVCAISKLDYPKSKLEVLLLVEEDDIETVNAISRLSLESYFKLVKIPLGAPRTKPKACNFGLSLAKGELLVIYDAEDRPEIDQLKKSVIAFRRGDKNLACLQAKLNFYNQRDNLITRFFTLEYSAWFDMFLPGLHIIRCPIPLGGTSNHFRTEQLREIGGWDPFNVTEDCDIGIELARNHLETRVLDSTTWEECPRDLLPWIKQRSRWMKGYLQTFLVHTRRPLRTALEMGVFRYTQILTLVGGHVFAMLANPISWAVLILWIFLRWRIFFPESPLTLFFVVLSAMLFSVNFLFIVLHFMAGFQRRLVGAFSASLLLPLYWAMISIGALRGIFQFLHLPHFWDKTIHGHSLKSGTRNFSAEFHESRIILFPLRKMLRIPTFILLFSLIAGTCAISAYIPLALHYPARIRQAKINFSGPSTQSRVEIEQSWIGMKTLEIKAKLKADEDPSLGLYRFRVFLKVNDGEWYQHYVDDYVVENDYVTIRVPLDSGWEAKGCDRPWGPWCLRRVKELGLKIFGETDFPLRQIALEDFKLLPEKTLQTLQAMMISCPSEFRQWAMLEFAFSLSREYVNPFDDEEIDASLEIKMPSGMKHSIPAFYYQDYERKLDGGKEILIAKGIPHWRVRYTPEESGTYSFKLVAKDKYGGCASVLSQTFSVLANDAKGFAKIDKGGLFFSWSNGEFLYPLLMNIRSPGDDLKLYDADYETPSDEMGTFVYDKYFEKMQNSGINVGRIWMTPWFGGIEWAKDIPGFHGLGEYNLQNSWRLDYLFDHARKKNLLIEVALLHHGAFTGKYDSQWKENPYNFANGGVLRYHQDFLTDPNAINLIKQRFRYISARYGAYQSLFAWVLWIEVNAICNNNHKIMGDWHKNIAKFLKDTDIGRHPISSEFSSVEGSAPVWNLPEIGYVQVAGYDSGSMGLTEVFQTYIKRLEHYSKPLVIEEYGGFWNGGTMEYVAQELHDGLWAAWMLPLSATPMPWWWNFIFGKNLERFYVVFSEYIKAEDLRKEKWSFHEFGVLGCPDMRCLSRIGENSAFGWIYDHKITNPQSSRNNRRIRNLGIKDVDKLYRGVVDKDFSPLNKDEFTKIFPLRKGLQIKIPGLKPGLYSVEFWDTWTKKAPTISQIQIESDGKGMTINIPEISADIAFKIKKL